jgi:predicted DNA-binding transcriptional regulator YafY
MPANRNALLRYQIIDKCLNNRSRRWTWKDILDKVNQGLFIDNPKSDGIGKTTLYEDLKNIEYKIYSLEIEKIKEGKTTYLRYSDPKASINNQPLSETEAEQLRAAITVISRFKGLPQFEWIHEIVPILESKMGLIETEKEIISFESNLDYTGATHIPTLYNAILNKKVLKMTYQSFRSPFPSEIEIHPQYLKQYNSRWFIMSFMDKWGDKPQINALDRIVEIEDSNSEYRTLKNFDWEDYFSDMIGVSRPEGKPVEVKILITDEVEASYINTKPIHQSQKKLKKVEGGYEASISVIPNVELEKLILSFGENIKILTPVSLQEKIKCRAEKMSRHYNKNALKSKIKV